MFAQTTTQITLPLNVDTSTGLTAIITPRTTSSRVLVTVNLALGLQGAYNGVPNNVGVGLFRGSTQIAGAPLTNGWISVYFQKDAVSAWSNYVTFTYLDSPNTTNGVSYNVQGRVTRKATSGDRTYAQPGGAPSYITLMEV